MSPRTFVVVSFHDPCYHNLQLLPYPCVHQSDCEINECKYNNIAYSVSAYLFIDVRLPFSVGPNPSDLAVSASGKVVITLSGRPFHLNGKTIDPRGGVAIIHFDDPHNFFGSYSKKTLHFDITDKQYVIISGKANEIHRSHRRNIK